MGVLTGDFPILLSPCGLVAISSVSKVSGAMILPGGNFYLPGESGHDCSSFSMGKALSFEYDFERFSIAVLQVATVFSAVMAIGLLPYLESGFGLVTSYFA